MLAHFEYLNPNSDEYILSHNISKISRSDRFPIVFGLFQTVSGWFSRAGTVLDCLQIILDGFQIMGLFAKLFFGSSSLSSSPSS